MSRPAAVRVAAIAQEIDAARRNGPLRQIVVPPCPELLTRLQQALAEAEPDLNEVARIANADVAMAATLIRNANGALFAGAPPVVSVGQAMNRLGLRQTAALMTGFLARHALPVNSALLSGFWEQSTRRAQALAWIAGQLPGLSPELAHNYGLFSHVGLPVLMQSVRGYAGTVVEARARKDRSFVETENANHRTDHAVVGALTARAWSLAPAVMAAIRLHHSLESLGAGDTEPEVHTLVAAGLVADFLLGRQAGVAPDADWEGFGAAACDWLGLSGDDLQHCLESFGEADTLAEA
ncbi:MAG: HDOD domain-containing protein [Piscinibacter sp.]